jgi:serine/threonine protein phosphatase PrpC
MDSFSLYGVFDGHGQKGHDVSNFAMDMLPKCIIKDERCFTTRDWGPILIEAFKKTQNFIMVSDKGKTIQAQMSGTTATVHASALRLARPCLGRIATVVLVSSGMTLPGI